MRSRHKKPPIPDSAAEFRRALGSFATGVAVVTTVDADGEDAGMTISSFNSVSLEPPLVLWSIARSSLNFDVFDGARYFAVNVLSSGQQSLAERFARNGGDRFGGIDCTRGIEGLPLLPGSVSSFQCRIEHRYDGGDHVIVVGRVLEYHDRGGEPLIFFRGRYLGYGTA